jgi:uncharacterized protein DUF4288
MSDSWFSTLLRFLTTVEAVGPTTYTRSVLVFKAADWEPARLRALELGRAHEATYENADGQRVARRLVEVETLDMLGDEIDDGREVYSEGVDVSDAAGRFQTIDRPENSRPTQSGV